MLQKALKKHAEKLRFGIVGILSTVIDFGILFGLVALGLPTITSNYVSTTVASVFNFLAHKSFTYNDKEKTSTRHIVSYIVVTMSGLWILQPIIITATTLVATGTWSTRDGLVILVGKVLATVAATIWNYILYRKFVFKKEQL